MPLVFYVATTGSDTNGGSSEGAAKASGTGAVTTGASTTIDLSADAPDLSTTNIGDTIRLNGRTDGKNGSDIFEITAKDDTLDTVAVTPTPGTTTSGVTWAIGGAWATIDRAMNVVSAGDKTWIKATANYNEIATMDRVGTVTAPIVFEGYTTTPGDGGRITIDGQSARANGITGGLGNVSAYYVFKNIRVTGCTDTGFLLGGSGGTTDRVTCKNCKADSNGTDGFSCDTMFLVEGCESSDNLGRGFSGSANSAFIGCTAYRNGTSGITAVTGLMAFCSAFSNADDNFVFSGAQGYFINCTADGDSDDSTNGFRFSGSPTNYVMVNCIMYDNATGLTSAVNLGENAICRNNLVNGNGTDYSGAATFTGEVISAPAFMDEATQDYRLDPSSPAAQAGFDGGTLGTGAASKIDIGAIQRADVPSAITAVISEQPIAVEAYGAEAY